MIYLSSLLIAMFITIALIPMFRGLAFRFKVLDIPEDRKVHTAPMPRIGGLAMALGILVPVLLWTPVTSFTVSTLLGMGILVLFGAIDDYKGLNYRIKFASQFVAALLVIVFGGLHINYLGALLPGDLILPDWLGFPLTFIVIIGVTNAINLADGLDGLAGGITLLSFICIGYLGYRCEDMVAAVMAFTASGAIVGFLRFNTYPAVIFMGDAGSQILGFLAITLSLKITQGQNPLSPLVPLLFLGLPVLDTLTVMAQRIAAGRSPFYPDKNHLHHRLMRLGLSHSEAVLALYVVQALLISCAYFFRFYSEWILLLIFLAFSGVFLPVLFLANKAGYQIGRSAIVDRLVKSPLREFRESGAFIKISFRLLAISLPLLFFATCLVPADIPRFFAWVTLGLSALLLVSLLLSRKWLFLALRVCLYLTIPVIIYQTNIGPSPLIGSYVLKLYNLSFLVVIALMFLTLRLSRRAGFQSTPMDYLIIFIALAVPNLPGAQIGAAGMGLAATKIIVLYFSFEVLMGELRGKLTLLGITTLLTLAVVCVRGFMLI